MALHIYSIYVICKDVEYICDEETWKLIGNSNFTIEEIDKKL